MKINFEHQLLYNHYLKRFHTSELYLKLLDSVLSDFEKYEILDEIHELFLFLQDEIYQIGRSKKFELYLSLLKDIKKYSMLDKYLNGRLFWNLYYSSYKKYFELVNEISELSKYDIQFLKPMQNIHEEYCKQAYDFEKRKFLINLDRKYNSIKENIILLGEKCDKRLIVSVLKKIKNLLYDVSSACLALGAGIVHDEMYHRLKDTAVLKINGIINDKIELSRCLHELNNEQVSLENYHEVRSLCDAILNIKPDWLCTETELGLLKLEKRLFTSEKINSFSIIQEKISFFSTRKNPRDILMSIIDNFFQLPVESELENFGIIVGLSGLDSEQIKLLISERQEAQVTFILKQINGFNGKVT